MRLATTIARVVALSQGEWAAARADQDVAAFLPRLAEVVALRREEAAALAAGDAGGDAYDALLEEYEPDITGGTVHTMFAAIRPRLVALRAAILETAPAQQLSGHFPRAIQMQMSRIVAQAFGYDFQHGRIDLSAHPFSSGSGQDVRITTRIDETDPLEGLYATAHEAGHATYEQNVNPAYLLTPIGQGASMGVHESQSRICENQLARSAPFCGWLYDMLRTRFGDIGVENARDFYRAVNRVGIGHIRTKADEVHYNLHVMLRFDLERSLINAALDVSDLEAAWNDRFWADFGVKVDRPSDGFLQDIHWAVGLFGYFPTYALGNVYAGCLHQAMRAAVPDLDAALARGDARPAMAWLRQTVQQHGALRSPTDTIAHATGAPPTPGPWLRYLETKFGDLYGLRDSGLAG